MAKEKEKKSIDLSFLIPCVTALLICVASFWYLLGSNADVLYMAQLRSLFLDNGTFFSECMQRPGGLLQWAGLFLTQLFYEPWQGVAALTLIWLLTFFISIRSFKVPCSLTPLAAIPVVCLIASAIDLGYWIYYIRMPGYFFRESLGFLIVAMLCHPLPLPKCLGGVLTAIIAAVLYPFIGYYSIVAMLCIAINNGVKRSYIASGVALLLTIATPLLFGMSTSTIRSDERFTAGMPVFENFGHVESHLAMPFYIAIASFILLSLMPLLVMKPLTGKLRTAGICTLFVAFVAGSAFSLEKVNVTDENFHAECRAYRAMEDMDWDGVLDAVSSVRGDITRELVIFKNIALFNQGDIGNTMYQYKDVGITPSTGDSLRINLAEVAAPVIYLHHGLTNFAYRWCIENSVEYGLNITEIKTMTLVALVNSDFKVAEKYLDMLSHTMHYKEWADKYRPLLNNPKAVANHPELKHISEIYRYSSNETKSDQSLCEKFIIDNYSLLMAPGSPYLQEMTLVYSMISKDIQKFWPHFLMYANNLKGKEMPIHYQEAAYLYGVLEPQSMDISHMPFNKERIIDRYAMFQQRSQQLLSSGLDQKAVGNAMLSEFGDTFWWSYFFDRGATYY